jgi:hypothetical protein
LSFAAAPASPAPCSGPVIQTIVFFKRMLTLNMNTFGLLLHFNTSLQTQTVGEGLVHNNLMLLNHLHLQKTLIVTHCCM